MAGRSTAALDDYHHRVSVEDRAAYITKSHAHHGHGQVVCRSRTIAHPTSLPCVLTSGASRVFFCVASALATIQGQTTPLVL